MNHQSNTFLWTSEIRSYEVDLQGIVNNAHYFHYFDHVRVQHLLSYSRWVEKIAYFKRKLRVSQIIRAMPQFRMKAPLKAIYQSVERTILAKYC